ncbi:hypothetical protein TNCV_1886591 [Trichonephila clavipes]|nr:hypothetical protein TNCV_1886591 [Trichonephila clavipes]
MYRHHPVVHNYKPRTCIVMVALQKCLLKTAHAGWYVDMMGLRSTSRVLRPRQFQEIKEVMKLSHLLLARSQKTKVWATDRPSDFRRFGEA